MRENKQKKINLNILNKIDLLDMLKINVVHHIEQPGQISVEFECLDRNKKLIMDPKVKREMDYQLNKKIIGMSVNNPNVKDYIKEFCGKYLSEMYRNGLCDIIEMEDAPTDHYQDLRKNFTTRR